MPADKSQAELAREVLRLGPDNRYRIAEILAPFRWRIDVLQRHHSSLCVFLLTRTLILSVVPFTASGLDARPSPAPQSRP